MTNTSKIQVVREMKLRRNFDWTELRTLLITRVLQEFADDPNADLLRKASPGSFKISFEQRSEGSPSYSISAWDASVSLTIEL